MTMLAKHIDLPGSFYTVASHFHPNSRPNEAPQNHGATEQEAGALMLIVHSAHRPELA